MRRSKRHLVIPAVAAGLAVLAVGAKPGRAGEDSGRAGSCRVYVGVGIEKRWVGIGLAGDDDDGSCPLADLQARSSAGRERRIASASSHTERTTWVAGRTAETDPADWP